MCRWKPEPLSFITHQGCFEWRYGYDSVFETEHKVNAFRGRGASEIASIQQAP